MHDISRLRARVKALFERELKIAIPSEELDLIESRYVDSLRFVDLLLAVEQEFQLKVSVDELDVDRFKSIAETACFIAEKQAG